MLPTRTASPIVDSDDGAVLPVGARDGAQVLRAGVAERVVGGVARREPLREGHDVALRPHRVPVDGGDDVAGADAGLRRGKPFETL